MDKFFCVTQPGFEDILKDEIHSAEFFLLNENLSSKATDKSDEQNFFNLNSIKGGIEFESSLFHAVQLNFFLKTCTRILWRIDAFKAKDFLALKEKLNRTKLKSMSNGYKLMYKISSNRSKIYNESRIRSICEDVLSKNKISDEDAKNKILYVHIHVLENEFQISLDLSEPSLYQRGWAPLKETAPLRESWVASFFLKSSFYQNLLNTPEAVFVDPCCGSGTLAWEFLTFSTPQFLRAFAFQNYPGTPKLFKLNFQHNYKLKVNLLKNKIFLFDKNSKCIETAKANQKIMGQTFGQDDLLSNISFAHQFDCLNSSSWANSDIPVHAPIYIASNLPYGERLESFKVEVLLEQLSELKSRGWNIKRSAFVVSENQYHHLQFLKKSKSIQMPYELLREIKFINGGLPCVFFELEWF